MGEKMMGLELIKLWHLRKEGKKVSFGNMFLDNFSVSSAGHFLFLLFFFFETGSCYVTQDWQSSCVLDLQVCATRLASSAGNPQCYQFLQWHTLFTSDLFTHCCICQYLFHTPTYRLTHYLFICLIKLHPPPHFRVISIINECYLRSWPLF
jgi:hypothetical protein